MGYFWKRQKKCAVRDPETPENKKFDVELFHNVPQLFVYSYNKFNKYT